MNGDQAIVYINNQTTEVIDVANQMFTEQDVEIQYVNIGGMVDVIEQSVKECKFIIGGEIM